MTPPRHRETLSVDLEASQDELSPAAREVVRASAPVAEVVASLLLALHPHATLYRVGGDLQRLLLDPPPRTDRLAQLRSLLFELAGRPEWRSRHLVTREVEDRAGRRLEALLPVAPQQYSSGARLVGPLATAALADQWGGDHAVATLSYDVFSLAGGAGTSDPATVDGEGVRLCDLFELPEPG